MTPLPLRGSPPPPSTPANLSVVQVNFVGDVAVTEGERASPAKLRSSPPAAVAGAPTDARFSPTAGSSPSQPKKGAAPPPTAPPSDGFPAVAPLVSKPTRKPGAAAAALVPSLRPLQPIVTPAPQYSDDAVARRRERRWDATVTHVANLRAVKQAEPHVKLHAGEPGPTHLRRVATAGGGVVETTAVDLFNQPPPHPPSPLRPRPVTRVRSSLRPSCRRLRSARLKAMARRCCRHAAGCTPTGRRRRTLRVI